MKNHLNKDLYLKINSLNYLQFPSIEKISVHSTLNKNKKDSINILPRLVALQLLFNQKAVVSRATKSIAHYKLQEGNILGCFVTFRKKRIEQLLRSVVYFILSNETEKRLYGKRNLSFDKRKLTLSVGSNNFFLFPQLETLYTYFEHVEGYEIHAVFNLPSSRNFGLKNSSKYSPSNLLASIFQYRVSSDAKD